MSIIHNQPHFYVIAMYILVYLLLSSVFLADRTVVYGTMFCPSVVCL